MIDDRHMGIDSLFENGYLEGTMQLTKSLQATYRTITADESQDVEGRVNVDAGKTIRYTFNQISIGHLEYGLVAIGSNRLPEDIGERREAIGSMPAMVLNILINGYEKFSVICEELLGEDSIEDF